MEKQINMDVEKNRTLVLLTLGCALSYHVMFDELYDLSEYLLFVRTRKAPSFRVLDVVH